MKNGQTGACFIYRRSFSSCRLNVAPAVSRGRQEALCAAEAQPVVLRGLPTGSGAGGSAELHWPPRLTDTCS